MRASTEQYSIGATAGNSALYALTQESGELCVYKDKFGH